MSNYQEKANELFYAGAQCAQAVFGALAPAIGMAEADALALSASFGGGIGRMREMCGALCGTLMALGARYGSYPLGDPVGTSLAKDRHYRLTQYATALFKRKTGSAFCYRLLDLPHAAQIPVSQPRTDGFYHARPCAGYVAVAIEVFEEILAAEEAGTLEELISPAAAAATTEFLNQEL